MEVDVYFFEFKDVVCWWSDVSVVISGICWFVGINLLNGV